MGNQNNSIGENIKKFRKAAGLTQRELAEKCGFATGTIQQYELGKREPRNDQQMKICDILEIPSTALITGELSTKAHLEFMSGMQDFMDALENTDGDIEAAKEIAELKIKMLFDYSQLNFSGQKKAAEQVNMLTKIPEYRKDQE